jgi:hypothetical protein
LKTGKELMDIALRCEFLFIKYQECCWIWNWKEWFGLAWKIIWGYLTLTCKS